MPRPTPRLLTAVAAVALLALAGCGETTTDTHTPIANTEAATKAFLKAFEHEAGVHPSTAGGGCEYNEGAWKCGAHGFSGHLSNSEPGSTETNQCHLDTGEVKKNGEVSSEATDDEADQCTKLAAEEETGSADDSRAPTRTVHAVAAKPPPTTTATKATIPCTGNRSGRCTAAPTTTSERSALPTAANCHAPNRSPHMERSCVEQQEDEEWATANERKREEREKEATASAERENSARTKMRRFEREEEEGKIPGQGNLTPKEEKELRPGGDWEPEGKG